MQCCCSGWANMHSASAAAAAAVVKHRNSCCVVLCFFFLVNFPVLSVDGFRALAFTLRAGFPPPLNFGTTEKKTLSAAPCNGHECDTKTCRPACRSELVNCFRKLCRPKYSNGFGADGVGRRCSLARESRCQECVCVGDFVCDVVCLAVALKWPWMGQVFALRLLIRINTYTMCVCWCDVGVFMRKNAFEPVLLQAHFLLCVWSVCG